MKNVLKKCNTITYKKIKEFSETQTFKIIIKLDNRRIIIIIDNNATTNFILWQLVKTLNLFTRIKANSYEIIVINENNLKSKNEKQITKKHNFYR